MADNDDVHDETTLKDLLEKFPLEDEEKGVYLVLRKREEGTWDPEWEKFMGVKPTPTMLQNLRPGDYAILAFGAEAMEEVGKMQNYTFTALPEGAQMFTVKSVVEMGEGGDDNEGSDDEEIPDAESEDFKAIKEATGMTHEEFLKLSKEERAELLKKHGDQKKKPAAGGSWDEFSYGVSGPKGVSLYDKDTPYPKPPKDKPEGDWTPYGDGGIIFGPKGVLHSKEGYPFPPKAADAMLDSGETSHVLMVDTVHMEITDDALTVNDKGELDLPSCTLAKPMVQPYRMGDKTVKILKCPDQLKEAVPFVDGRYVCDDHPIDRRVTQPSQIKGRIHDTKITDDGKLDAELTVMDKGLITKIQNGKRDLSIGFDCGLLWKPGVWKDAEGKEHPYDAVQVNILIDHVAVVEQGRCSIFDGCGIHLDEKDTEMLKRLDEMDGLNAEVKTLSDQLKAPIIDTILSMSDRKTREDLMKLPITDLNELKDMALDAKDAPLPGAGKGKIDNVRQAIDDKLAELGKVK